MSQYDKVTVPDSGERITLVEGASDTLDIPIEGGEKLSTGEFAAKVVDAVDRLA